MNLGNVKSLISAAKEVKVKKERGQLEHQIELKQAELDLEVNKQRSADVELNSTQDKLGELRASLNEVSNLLSDDDVRASMGKELDEAQNVLIDKINETEKRIEAIQDTIADLSNDIMTRKATLGQLRDRRKMLDEDPEKLSSSYIDHGTSNALLTKCRPSVRDLYVLCDKRLDDMLDSHDSNEKRRHECELQAARLKLLQAGTPDLTNAEQMLIRQSFGAILRQVRTRAPGWVNCLDKSFGKDWSPSQWQNFINDVNGRLLSPPKTPPQPKQPKAENDGNQQQESKQDKQDALQQVKDSALPEIMDGKRVAIYGGVSTKQDGLVEWMEGNLGLKRVKWYECTHDNKDTDSLVTSIKNSGTDVIVMMTQWVDHKSWQKIVGEARKSGVPVVLCSSSGKSAVINKLADQFGVSLSA